MIFRSLWPGELIIRRYLGHNWWMNLLSFCDYKIISTYLPSTLCYKIALLALWTILHHIGPHWTHHWYANLITENIDNKNCKFNVMSHFWWVFDMIPASLVDMNKDFIFGIRSFLIFFFSIWMISSLSVCELSLQIRLRAWDIKHILTNKTRLM